VHIRRGGPESVQVLTVAYRLAQDGAADDQAIAELRSLGHPPQTFRESAALLAGTEAASAERMRGWLLGAAGDRPIRGTERTQQERDELTLVQLPTAEAFRLLADRLPALSDLERQAANTDSLKLTGLVPRLLRLTSKEPGTARIAALVELRKKARALVGPTSGHGGGLTASPAAMTVVMRHLSDVLGLN